MLKSRFGEDFWTQVQANVEVRAPEQKRTQKFDKRRGGKDQKRQPRQEKKEELPVATTTEQTAAQTGATQ